MKKYFLILFIILSIVIYNNWGSNNEQSNNSSIEYSDGTRALILPKNLEDPNYLNSYYPSTDIKNKNILTKGQKISNVKVPDVSNEIIQQAINVAEIFLQEIPLDSNSVDFRTEQDMKYLIKENFFNFKDLGLDAMKLSTDYNSLGEQLFNYHITYYGKTIKEKTAHLREFVRIYLNISNETGYLKVNSLCLEFL